MLAFVEIMAYSCSDDDDRVDEPITVAQLPASARSFIDSYYPGSTISHVNKDREDGVTEYEVRFADGHEITFDADGRWIDIDAPYGMSIPAGIVPEKIDGYISANYPGEYINEISKTYRGYEVELTSDTDLIFDRDGNFQRIDY